MNSIEVNLGNAGYKIMANVYEDGDQWCVSIGNMPNGCFGFGYTIDEAVAEFKSNCRNRATK